MCVMGHTCTCSHTEAPWQVLLLLPLTRAAMSRLNQGMRMDQGHTSSVPTKSARRLGFLRGVSKRSTPLAATSTANS